MRIVLKPLCSEQMPNLQPSKLHGYAANCGQICAENGLTKNFAPTELCTELCLDNAQDWVFVRLLNPLIIIYD